MSLPRVRCPRCGGDHFVWGCPSVGLVLKSEGSSRGRGAALCAPPGECEHCDRRRAYAAASMRRWRAEKAGDSG
jgi:hypothetical protein